MSVKLVPIQQIDRAQPARSLKPELVDRLAASIKSYGGLFQAVGVIPVDDRFRLVWGNHRLAACKAAGRKDIEARILPPDTTPDRELEFSIQENHLRAEESFEDVLARVHELASRKDCSFAQAAEIAGVSPSYVSKAQSTLKRLAPMALKLARENKVGIGVLYAVAKAETEAQQLKLLTGFLSGALSRDAIEQAVKKSTTKRPRRLNINLQIDGVGVKFALPAEITYDQLANVLSSLKGRINSLSKQQIPVDALPNVFK